MIDEQGKKPKTVIDQNVKRVGIIIAGLFVFFYLGHMLIDFIEDAPRRNAARAATGGEDRARIVSEAISVTAVDLYSAYENNALRADNTYKEKLVMVTGRVSGVDQDIVTKKPYVKLISGAFSFRNYLEVYFIESALKSCRFRKRAIHNNHWQLRR